VDKTRCSAYTQEKLRLAARPDAQYFEPFIQWLAGTESPPVAKPLNKPWSTFGEMVQEFAKLQTALPADVYTRNLAACGVGRQPIPVRDHGLGLLPEAPIPSGGPNYIRHARRSDEPGLL
jgi:hypothetical protein